MRRLRELLCWFLGHRLEYVLALDWHPQPEDLISPNSTSLYRCTRCGFETVLWHRVHM